MKKFIDYVDAVSGILFLLAVGFLIGYVYFAKTHVCIL